MSQLNQHPTDRPEMRDHDAMSSHKMTGHSSVAQSDHGGHGDHVGQFRRLFWIMLTLAIPVVVFSDMFAVILSYELPALPFVA